MSMMRALEVGENMALQRQTDRESEYITSSTSRACKNDLGIFGDGGGNFIDWENADDFNCRV